MEFKENLDNIYILARGPTWHLCPEVGENSELWGLNGMYRDRPDLDRLFIMHDIRKIALHEDARFVDSLNKLGVPVYTNAEVSALDKNVLFPAQEVMDTFGVNYIMNVVCWMLALAISLKPKNIHLFGADYHYAVDQDEKACTEFWIGAGWGRGINIHIPPCSALCKPPELREELYGYIVDRYRSDGLMHVEPDLLHNPTFVIQLPDMDNGGKLVEYKLVPREEQL